MSDEQLDAQVESALARLRAAPGDHAHAERQGCFYAYSMSVYCSMKETLLEEFPEMGSQPFDLVDSIISSLSLDALRGGAQVYAALVRDPGDELVERRPVGMDSFAAAFSAMGDSDSEVAMAWSSAKAQLPQFGGVLEAVADVLMSSALQSAPSLTGRVQWLGNWLMENLSRGAVAEFCLGRLLWEMEEASAVAPLPVGVLPWPSDEVCLCGRSLAPAMYCCDQTAPFSMKLYPDVGPEFSLMRPCCGQLLRGFQCDACSRVFSWEAGVREVH